MAIVARESVFGRQHSPWSRPSISFTDTKIRGPWCPLLFKPEDLQVRQTKGREVKLGQRDLPKLHSRSVAQQLMDILRGNPWVHRNQWKSCHRFAKSQGFTRILLVLTAKLDHHSLWKQQDSSSSWDEETYSKCPRTSSLLQVNRAKIFKKQQVIQKATFFSCPSLRHLFPRLQKPEPWWVSQSWTSKITSHLWKTWTWSLLWIKHTPPRREGCS